MKEYDITYKIFKDFLFPTKEYQEEFNKIDFVPKEKDEMQTTYGSKLISNLKSFVFLQKFFNKRQLSITNIWAQKYINGRHRAHIHNDENSHLSFVWYVQADENCSKIIFYNPGWPYIDSHKFDIQPYTGTLLIFDKSIPHEVLENKNQKRNIISGNLKWQK